MSFIMGWQLRAVLIASAALACTPDEFEYGSSGAGGAPTCHEDGCAELCPDGSPKGPGPCAPVCGEWQASVEMPSPGGLVVVGSTVYAAGTSAAEDGRPAQGMLQPADACGGALADAILPMSDKGSSLSAASASGGSVVVAGPSEGKITFAVLDAASGAAKSTHVAAALPADAVVEDLSADASGAWAAGSSKTSGAWFARLAAGSVCSALLPGAQSARAVAASQDAALIVVEAGAKLRVARVEGAACAAPSFTSPDLVLPGVDSASARDLLVVDSTAYLVGHARAGASEPHGFVAALDVSSGALQAFAKWDPGPGADALRAVAAVGTQLWAGGVSGAAQPDDDATGGAALAVWKLPLEDGAAPLETLPLPAQRVQALAGDGASVFALAAGNEVSVLWSLAAD